MIKTIETALGSRLDLTAAVLDRGVLREANSRFVDPVDVVIFPLATVTVIVHRLQHRFCYISQIS